jgi:hypothetical protein
MRQISSLLLVYPLLATYYTRRPFTYLVQDEYSLARYTKLFAIDDWPYTKLFAIDDWPYTKLFAIDDWLERAREIESQM